MPCVGNIDIWECLSIRDTSCQAYFNLNSSGIFSNHKTNFCSSSSHLIRIYSQDFINAVSISYMTAYAPVKAGASYINYISALQYNNMALWTFSFNAMWFSKRYYSSVLFREEHAHIVIRETKQHSMVCTGILSPSSASIDISLMQFQVDSCLHIQWMTSGFSKGEHFLSKIT